MKEDKGKAKHGSELQCWFVRPKKQGFLTVKKYPTADSFGIFAGCLMWPHLFPLYASQIFETILANGKV